MSHFYHLKISVNGGSLPVSSRWEVEKGANPIVMNLSGSKAFIRSDHRTYWPLGIQHSPRGVLYWYSRWQLGSSSTAPPPPLFFRIKNSTSHAWASSLLPLRSPIGGGRPGEEESHSNNLGGAGVGQSSCMTSMLCSWCIHTGYHKATGQGATRGLSGHRRRSGAQLSF